MRLNRLYINALAAVGQSLITLACVFAGYRILIAHQGLEQVGIWSLLVAGSSLARLGDFSGAGALARFVAADDAVSGNKRGSEYIHTVVLTTSTLYFSSGLLIYLASGYVIGKYVEARYVAEATSLLPYAISNVCLGAIVTALFSGIDGLQRAYLRALIGGCSALLFLSAAWLLIPKFGTAGFASALLLQQLFMLIAGWIVLREFVPNLGWLPTRWSKRVFFETTTFGIKIQATALASMLLEPLAKFLIGHWGGLGGLGIYELASRLVVQGKALVIAGAQPLIAAFAGIEHGGAGESVGLLLKSTRAAIWLAAAATVAVIGASPILSIVMLHVIDPRLVIITCALAVGWNINLMCGPIYFAAIGGGVVRWNLISHLTIGILMLVFGYPLGYIWGTGGVIGSIVLSLLIGTGVVVLGNSLEMNTTLVWYQLRRTAVIGVCFICGLSGSVMFLANYLCCHLR